MLQECSGYWADHVRKVKPESWNIYGSGDVTSGTWMLHDASQLEAVVAGERKLIFPGDQNTNKKWCEFSEAGQSTIGKQIRTGTSSKEHGPS